jgi:lipid-A-disaccharide synthase-like uncharacterized protein
LLVGVMTFGEVLTELRNPLVLFGFAGQFVFMLRFLVQWLVSERRGRSMVPVAFWYLSCAGGLMLLIYAVLREDLVFMAGQSLGLVIYLRNLALIHRRRRRLQRRQALVDSGGSREALPAGPGIEGVPAARRP